MDDIYRQNRHWKRFNMIQRRPRFGETKAQRHARKRRAENAERRRRRWFNAKKTKRPGDKTPPETRQMLK
jgi:hypothetical protein